VTAVTVAKTPAGFELGEANEVFGSALHIMLPSPVAEGGQFDVCVAYSTSPDSTALQWLAPEQTAGRQKPFVFSQCQAIHARSMLPCIDAPGAKSTYSARVTAPAWATVLMSALEAPPQGPPAPTSKKVFGWNQPVPTSTYLIALAAGDLASREISKRCRVWSEPSMVEAAAFEFSQTEDFLQTAEKLAGPYRWTRYDLLCLPPSFPYGGMENPCLTFVTPTLLAGDKSLADVVAHEIAHSWTGNLVTNATWTHFWLNEGWTKWFEQTIMTEIAGDDRYFDLRASLGLQALKGSVAHYGPDHAFTCLVPPLEGVDPDDSFSSVPYEKGMHLLFHLQQRVGKPAFLAFFRKYVDAFAFKNITTQDFRLFFEKEFADQPDKIAGIDWEAWFVQPGMLPVQPTYDLSLVDAVKELAADFIQDRVDQTKLQNPEYDFNSWNSLRQQLFLQELLQACSKSPLPVATLDKLDALYHLTGKKNSELRFKWVMMCLKCGKSDILADAAAFAVSQGRMKFVRPLYRALLDTSIPGGRELAIGTFAANRSLYHPICRKMVANDIACAIAADQHAAGSEQQKAIFFRGIGFGIGVAAAAVSAGFILSRVVKQA